MSICAHCGAVGVCTYIHIYISSSCNIIKDNRPLPSVNNILTPLPPLPRVLARPVTSSTPRPQLEEVRCCAVRILQPQSLSCTHFAAAVTKLAPRFHNRSFVVGPVCDSFRPGLRLKIYPGPPSPHSPSPPGRTLLLRRIYDVHRTVVRCLSKIKRHRQRETCGDDSGSACRAAHDDRMGRSVPQFSPTTTANHYSPPEVCPQRTSRARMGSRNAWGGGPTATSMLLSPPSPSAAWHFGSVFSAGRCERLLARAVISLLGARFTKYI